jgi:hypothetical protein
MSRFGSIVWILVMGLMVSSVALAADQAAQPAAATTDAAASTTTAAAPAADQSSPAVPAATDANAPTQAAPAAVAPAAIPALKPIVITFSGELAAVDAKATPATVTVQDRYGVRKEISLPSEAKITQNGAAKTAADLKVGDKLTVEYTYDVASGKRTAQVITCGENASSKAANSQEFEFVFRAALSLKGFDPRTQWGQTPFVFHLGVIHAFNTTITDRSKDQGGGNYLPLDRGSCPSRPGSRLPSRPADFRERGCSGGCGAGAVDSGATE